MKYYIHISQFPKQTQKTSKDEHDGQHQNRGNSVQRKHVIEHLYN
jgi:hypothetical protein